MMPRSAMSFVALAIASVGCMAAWCADRPDTSGAEAIIPLETTASARPTTATAPPYFDAWAPQPRLNCSLPAIEAWNVVRNVHAKTSVSRQSLSGDGPVQIIFAQRPFENPGLSKYSVIYQPTRRNVADRNVWLTVAANYYVGLRDSIRKDAQNAATQISSPTVSTLAELPRIYLTYRVERKSGERVSAAALCAPIRHGILIFNLALEGQEPEAIEAAMRELRHAVNIGLTRHTRSATPYVIAVLLAIPLVVGGVLLFRKRRARPSDPTAR